MVRFRSHVGWRTYIVLKSRLLITLYFTVSEIYNFWAVIIHHDISRLQVPVHNFMVNKVLITLQNLFNNLQRSFLTKKTLVFDEFLQSSTITKLGNHEAESIILKYFQPFQNKRVAQQHQSSFLHPQQILSDFIIDGTEFYYFDSYFSFCLLIMSFIYAACRAFPKNIIHIYNIFVFKLDFRKLLHIERFKYYQAQKIQVQSLLRIIYLLLKYQLYTMGSRPENQLPPDLYYNIDEASKYESNSRIQFIQRQIAERAIELLNLQAGSLVLDIGCGSGLSGETLTENGYIWEGIDISRDMLNIASQKNLEGGLWQFDIGQGWKVRPGVFDGAISISTIQWLCVASKRTDNPFKRCCKFFQSLYDSLRIGARAVLQFYPDGKNQLEMITSAAMKSGFTGGLVVDYPNSTRAKKYYLVIEAGVRRNLAIVQVQGKTQQQNQMQQKQEDNEVKLNKADKSKLFKKKGKKILKRKEVVLKRKERLRRKGKVIKPDTKYTGRRRKPKF